MLPPTRWWSLIEGQPSLAVIPNFVFMCPTKKQVRNFLSVWLEWKIINFSPGAKVFFRRCQIFQLFFHQKLFFAPLCSIQPSTSTSIGAFQGKEAKDGEKKNENSDILGSLGAPNYLLVVCCPRGRGVMDRVSACGACSTGLLRRSNVCLFYLGDNVVGAFFMRICRSKNCSESAFSVKGKG